MSGQTKDLAGALAALQQAYGGNQQVRNWLQNPGNTRLPPVTQKLVNDLLATYGVTAQDVVNSGGGERERRGGRWFRELGTAVHNFLDPQADQPSDLPTRAANISNMVAQSGGPRTLPGNGDYGLTEDVRGPVTGRTDGGLAGVLAQATQQAQQRVQARAGGGGAPPSGGGAPPSGGGLFNNNLAAGGGSGGPMGGIGALGESVPWNTGYGATAMAQPDLLTDEALRQMGYNPYRLGTFGEALRQQLDPIIKAQAGFAGFDPATASGDQSGAPDYTKLQGWLGGLGNSFLTPGLDAYAQVRQQAGGLAGNQGLTSRMADLNDPDALGYIRNLNQLRNAGASDLSLSANAQRMREFEGLRDLLARQGYKGGTMMDYLNTQPADSDWRRRLALLTGM